MPLIYKLFKKNKCFYTEIIKINNDYIYTIAQFNLKMYILQQYYKNFNFEFKSYKKQFNRIQTDQEFHRQFMYIKIIINICNVHRITFIDLFRKLCKNLNIMFSHCVIICTENCLISKIFRVF